MNYFQKVSVFEKYKNYQKLFILEKVQFIWPLTFFLDLISLSQQLKQIYIGQLICSICTRASFFEYVTHNGCLNVKVQQFPKTFHFRESTIYLAS